jgi:integrase
MRKLNLLTELQVRNAKPAKGKFVDRLPDGGNLYLQVTKSLSEGGGYNRNWIFRYQLDGRKNRHDLGLGPAHTVGLKQARAKAAELRMQLYEGIDPAQERKAIKAERKAKLAAEIKRTTFAECWHRYFRVHSPTWKSSKHRQQWESSMRTYVLPTLGPLNVADIETPHVVKVLEPIWIKKAETASRVQNRIKLVMDAAIAGGHRKDNPALRGPVKALLGKAKRGNGHYEAMPYADAPGFMAELGNRDLVSARALEFTILTAVRTSETLGATWDEIDLPHKLWTIPAKRMKADRDHRVPLSNRAVDILKSLPHSGKHVFMNGKHPFNDNSLLKLLRGMRDATVHGFRATFRTWLHERTSFPHDLGELCLAHKVGDKTVQAYQRGDGLQKRVRLMQAWADFLAKPLPASAETVDLHSERQRRSGKLANA